jgi:hypothetical protein
VRSTAEDLPSLSAIRKQSYGYGRVSRTELARVSQEFFRGVGIFEIEDERVKPLLMQTINRSRGIAETLNRDPKGRENPAQDLGSRLVAGYQQCHQGHI